MTDGGGRSVCGRGLWTPQACAAWRLISTPRLARVVGCWAKAPMAPRAIGRQVRHHEIDDGQAASGDCRPRGGRKIRVSDRVHNARGAQRQADGCGLPSAHRLPPPRGGNGWGSARWAAVAGAPAGVGLLEARGTPEFPPDVVQTGGQEPHAASGQDDPQAVHVRLRDEHSRAERYQEARGGGAQPAGTRWAALTSGIFKLRIAQGWPAWAKRIDPPLVHAISIARLGWLADVRRAGRREPATAAGSRPTRRRSWWFGIEAPHWAARRIARWG